MRSRMALILRRILLKIMETPRLIFILRVNTPPSAVQRMYPLMIQSRNHEFFLLLNDQIVIIKLLTNNQKIKNIRRIIFEYLDESDYQGQFDTIREYSKKCSLLRKSDVAII